jgi:hypothetical protein
MAAQYFDTLVRNAERLYAEKLQAQLEKTHPDEFVAVEPIQQLCTSA